jgi:hypothetical protein
MRSWSGLLPLMVGLALLAAPWWSSTLPATDYPLAFVLGSLFAGIGLAVAIPDSWPRVRSLGFVMLFAAFGTACAAIALSPLRTGADDSHTIGGVAGFAFSEPLPWWARLVAGLFGLLFLGLALLGLRGLVHRQDERD